MTAIFAVNRKPEVDEICTYVLEQNKCFMASHCNRHELISNLNATKITRENPPISQMGNLKY